MSAQAKDPIKAASAGPGTLALPIHESIPLIAPQPPRLSLHLDELQTLEGSGIYSNYGPINTLLERELIEQVFATGHCVTVCNATIGLMIAIREVLGECPVPERRYALMPSFTFAAAAQAAVWCGLTPLFCDIDADSWVASAASEAQLLRKYAGQIAVLVPYATFGNDLNLDRYARLAAQHDIPVVVDAAASLGSLSAAGQPFGASFPWPIVFSMHATKVFSVGEGGLIYSADGERIERLRRMGCFGFAHDRAASGIGLNAKMAELTALVARLQLKGLPEITRHQELLAAAYTAELSGDFALQQETGTRQVRSFFPLLLPRELIPARDHITGRLRAQGIGTGTYFSPHVAQQPFFRHMESCPLPVTADVAARVVSLPFLGSMTAEQVHVVADRLREAVLVETTSILKTKVRSPEMETPSQERAA